MVVTAVTV